MQTFLPYERFVCTALALDDRRLGKQRVEALQILNAIHRPGHGWRNHPAVRMWREHVEALVCYGVVVTRVWRRRGYRDTVLEQLLGYAPSGRPRSQRALAAAGLLPPWLGMPELHRSHRSALMRKNPEWYGRFFGEVPPDIPYVWPVRTEL